MNTPMVIMMQAAGAAQGTTPGGMLGGGYGTIKEVNQTTVVLEIDKNVTIEVDKTMIMRAPGA